MEEKKPVSIAQVSIISSVITLLVLIGIFYIFRAPIAAFLLSEQSSPVVTAEMMQPSEPLVTMIERVNPAVVSVVVTKDVPVFEQVTEQLDPWGFFTIPRLREAGTEEQEVGGGSGFIVSADGLIVTNRHVVEDESARYSVVLSDGSVYPVDVVARDGDFDVAILRITEPLKGPLTVLEFGDSDTLKLGQTVVAIGNALAEFQNSVSVGVISGLSRSVTAQDGRGRTEMLDQVIQTDTAINPGNSGGPLLDSQGRVIGVTVATSRGADNISFALPAQLVKQAVESVKANGEIIRPYLGVRYVTITPKLAAERSLPRGYGALVVRGERPDEGAIVPGSPADKAGIKEGDIIVAVNDISIKGRDLLSVIRTRTVGETITIRFLREGEENTVSVTLEEAL